LGKPKYLILLHPNNGNWEAVVLKEESLICRALPSTTEKPLVVGDWWLDYLTRPIDFLVNSEPGGWEPIVMAIQRVSQRPPQKILERLIKHL
jgi:hypothetical protein